MNTQPGLLIRDGMIIAPAGPTVADLAIEDGRFARLGKGLELDEGKVIEAAGLVVAPGAIDPHVHLDLLTFSGQTSSDDFAGGTAAALWGGVTTIGDFAYPAPGQRLVEALRQRRKLAKKGALTDFFLHVAILESPPDLEEQIVECWEEGARTFKVHMNDNRCGPEFLDRVCRRVARLGGLLLVHAEQGREIENNRQKLLAEGRLSVQSLPRSVPPELEAGAIRQVLAIAENHGTRIYVVHLSSRLGLEEIRKAKSRKIDVAAEVCIQHLLLNEEAYNLPGAHYIACFPPLRTDADREALWEGLADGSIDTVATDHCPFLCSQKDLGKDDFTKLAMGIAGVETMVPILWSEGRRRGLSYERLAELSSTASARIFGFYPAKGAIQPGAVADLFIYNPERRFKIDWKKLHMNCDFSPYQGLEIVGFPELTIKGGKVWEGSK